MCAERITEESMKKSSKETIKKALDEMGDEQTPEQKEKILKLTQDIYGEGKTPADAMGIDPGMTEGMYSFAHRLYTLGKYDQAAQMFRLLIMMNPMEMRFLLGVSACYHMQKDYDLASSSYMLCSLVNPRDPVPYYHASDCFIELGDYEMAEKCLKLCIAYCEIGEEYDMMKDRAQISLKGVLEKRQSERSAKKTEKSAKKPPPAEPPQTEAKKSA